MDKAFVPLMHAAREINWVIWTTVRLAMQISSIVKNRRNNAEYFITVSNIEEDEI